jgi:spoIIIJ-associated protein
MAVKEQVYEATGVDVEEAVNLGLTELGLGRDQVEIEVLDEGSGGFLGIGGRNARVRLTAKDDSTVLSIDESLELPPSDLEESEAAVAEAEDHESAEPIEVGPAEDEVAVDIVGTLISKMGIEAEITTYLTEPEDESELQRWVVDIRGEDLGILIGPRGETLNSLQFISRLMAGHELRRRATYIIDVEGYRERREKALARLAERMADKVIRRGHPLTLEPMPPNDRRIIHITLQEHAKVYTESTGEGKYRKVRIYPK